MLISYWVEEEVILPVEEVILFCGGGYTPCGGGYYTHEIILSALGLVIAIARARARPRSLTIIRVQRTYLASLT